VPIPDLPALTQLAESRKYSSQHKVWVVELGAGQFAMFVAGTGLTAIGTWDDMGAAMTARPIPTRRDPHPSGPRGDLSDVLRDLGLA
jgi:hypothetical protein